MSTPDKTIFRIKVSRRKGVSPSRHMAFIREAIARYKAGMYPGDPFFNYSEEDVEVYGRRRREPLGYALVCRDREGFPKLFTSLEEAERVKASYPELPFIRMVSVIAADLKPD